MKSKPMKSAILAAAMACAAIAPRAARATPEAAAAAGVDLMVAYVEATGAQYIDTGITASLGLKFEASFEWTGGAGDASLFGARTSSNRYYPIHWAGEVDWGWWMLGAGNIYTYPVEGSPTETASSTSGRPLIVWEKYRRYNVVADMAAGTQTITHNGKLIHVGSLYDATTPPALSMFLFGVNSSGSAAQFAKVHLYFFRIWQNGTLVRDYRPARQGSVYGLWEDCQGVFRASESSTPFAAAPAVTLDIPYCESTGAQFIGTGVNGGPGVKTEVVLEWVDGSLDGSVVGSKNAGNTRVYPVYGNQTHLCAGINSFIYIMQKGSGSKGQDYAVDERHTIVSDFGAASQTVDFDGVRLLERTETLADNGLPLFLFALNNEGTADAFSAVRIYSLKIWKDGTLVRDYRPARHGSVHGLWDACQSVFCNSESDTPFVVPTLDFKVPYCEATGAQYIDTGVTASLGLKFEASFAWTDGAVDESLFGARTSDNRYYPIHWAGNNAAGSWMLGAGGVYTYPVPGQPTETTNWQGTKIGWEKDRRYTAVADMAAGTQTITCDGTLIHVGSLYDVTTPPALSMFLFGVNSDGSAAQLARVRLYSLRIWQNDVLIRDYRPAREGTIYGLWEECQGVFCASASSKQFARGLRGVSGEPDYYAQWIASSGTTYIDTGIKGNPDVKAEATVSWTSTSGDRFILAAQKASDVRCNMIYQDGGRLAAGIISFDRCNIVDPTVSSTDSSQHVPIAARQTYTITADFQANAQSIVIDGGDYSSQTVFSRSVAMSATDLPLYIFARNNEGVADYFAAARVYAMKLWRNGVLVRDFVPGIRDGEGCLYDKVTGVCFLSANGAITSAAGLVGPPAGTPTRPKWELSFLGSEGNSYIDTGVIGNPNVKATATAAWTSTPGDRFILAAQKAGDVRCNMVYQDSGCLAAGVDSFERCNNTDPTVVPEHLAQRAAVAADQTYTITADFQANAQSIVIDGGAYSSQTVFSRTKAMADTDLPLYIFARNYIGTADNFAAARVYSLKIWRNGALVRNYVPVIADNGGPYLYDKVTRTFLQGATSGLWDVGEKGERYAQGLSVILR